MLDHVLSSVLSLLKVIINPNTHCAWEGLPVTDEKMKAGVFKSLAKVTQPVSIFLNPCILCPEPRLPNIRAHC